MGFSARKEGPAAVGRAAAGHSRAGSLTALRGRTRGPAPRFRAPALLALLVGLALLAAACTRVEAPGPEEGVGVVRPTATSAPVAPAATARPSATPVPATPSPTAEPAADDADPEAEAKADPEAETAPAEEAEATPTVTPTPAATATPIFTLPATPLPAPTPRPTATPTAAPRPTATPPPTMMPVPTVAPTSTPPALPTPAGPLPPGYADLTEVAYLEANHPAAAQIIRALPWVADGVAPEEGEAATSLIYLANHHQELFAVLTHKPWLKSAGRKELTLVLGGLAEIGERAPDIATAMAAMHFLNGLGSADLAAMESLRRFSDDDHYAFRRAMHHPRLRDGIDNQEAQVVALLWQAHRADPGLVTALLEESRDNSERITIDLPLAGEVDLAVIRLAPGAPDRIYLLENAVRTAEALVGEPFPTEYVGLLVADAVSSDAEGTNFGTHIVIRPEYDALDDSPESAAAGLGIAQLVAYYYWQGNRDWLDAGAAKLTAAVAEQERVGRPAEPNQYPCSLATNLRELEDGDYPPGSAGYDCNYSLGQRLFLELYRGLGDGAFRQGFRNLYRTVDFRREGPEEIGIERVQEAFGAAGALTGEAAANIVKYVVRQWYDGTVPHTLQHLDRRAAEPQLPEGGGRIDQAYISLTPEGAAASKFSAADVDGPVYLNLKHSYGYARDSGQLRFELTEAFADGFVYRRSDWAVAPVTTVEGQEGGSYRTTVGPAPGRDWRPGRHWVYLYHRGQKVAEVEFEVTR